MTQDDEDQFYALRSAFYAGDHQDVLKQAKSLKSLSGIDAKERDSYVCRSYIAQGKFKEANQLIGDSVATPLLAVKQLLMYKQTTDEDERQLIIDQIKDIIKEESSVLNNITFCVVSAQIFILNKLYKDALRIVSTTSNSSANLEKLIMQIQIYLCINRIDLANNIYNKMKEIDDDDVLTNIAIISIGIFTGKPESVKNSIEYIENLMSTRDTTLLRNLLSICYLQLHDYTNSWKNIGRARDLWKNLKKNNDIKTSTLINGITCLRNLNKGIENLVPKMEKELVRIDPNHQYLKTNKEMEELFDKSAQNFKE